MIFKFIFIIAILLQLSTLTYCYVEALTANLDNGLTHFMPMFAMLCGHGKFHNQYLNEQKQWVTDNDPTATCIKDKLEILEYCRKVYPKKDIRNIVESNHYYKIDNWKSVKSTRHHQNTNEKQRFVKPIRCLEGNFQSDALLVPEHCVFDHIHNASACESNTYWNRTANQSCKDKGKMLQSYAVLLPCGVGIFNGVEFVCCPLSTSSSQNEISDRPRNFIESSDFRLPSFSASENEAKTNEKLIKPNNKKLLNKKQRFNKDDQDDDRDENSSMEDDSDNQGNTANDQDIKYDENFDGKYKDEDDDKRPLPKKVSSGKKLSKISNQEDDDDEYYDDDYHDDDYKEENSIRSSTTTTTTTTTTETPLEIYYSHFDSKNEHNLFKMAEDSLKKIQLEKMKKIFKDYADFQTRLGEKKDKRSRKVSKKSSSRNQDEVELDENLKKTMEKRYEDALESLELQNNEEKQQLNAMHQQRVLTLINMKKQEATDCYTSSLNQTPLKPKKIQKCLEKLMKSLEKDRIHTLHHYKHLLQVSSKLALKEKAATLTHLENLIVIANRSISMLNKYPTLNDKIRNHIIAFWHNLRGVPFNQLISRDTEQQIMEKYEEEIAQKQQEKEHRKMLEEVKKERMNELKSTSTKKSSDDLNNKSQTTDQKSTIAVSSTATSSVDSNTEKSGTNKSSNIKYTARYTANSKMTKQLGNKQAAQLHQQINKPIVANMQHSRQHHEASFKLSEQLPEQHHLSGFKPIEQQNQHTYVTFSIAGIAIVLAIISGVVLYRNSSSSAHLSQGFVALQQQQANQQINNNEQQQVEALQINGYENPTYKYFEKNII